MRSLTATTSLLALLALLGPLAAAQPTHPTAGGATAHGEQLPLLQEEQLSLRKYHPKVLHPKVLGLTASRIYGRKFLVGPERSGARGPISNILTVGEDLIIVYDTQLVADRVMNLLSELEGAVPEQQPAEEELLEYAPRHVSLDTLVQAIEGYGTRSRSGSHRVVSYRPVPAANRLVIKAAPDRLPRIERLLRSVDVPPPQVNIICWVVRGVDAAEEDGKELPAELVHNLRQLLPYAAYEYMGTGIVRASATPDSGISLQIGLSQGSSASIQFRPESFGAKGDRQEAGLLSLGSFQCRIQNPINSSQQQFSTELAVPLDAYTVLGAMGSQPVFVVLKVVPAQS